METQTKSASGPVPTKSNFFWLSSYSKIEIASAFLTPLSVKSSRGSFFQKQRSPLANSSTTTVTPDPESGSSSSPSAPSPITTQPRSDDLESHKKIPEEKRAEGGDAMTSSDLSRPGTGMAEPQQTRAVFTSASTLCQVDLEKQEPPEDPKSWKAGRSEWLVMVTMAVCCLTVALDSTILVPVLPTLALELDGTADEAFWTGTSYLLASAVVQPFIATLSDVFGRRSATLVSVSLFAIASIICGVSHNFAIFLSGRVLQGVGGGGIISQSQLVFADIVPLRQRPRYFSLVLGSWAIGSMLGPLVGGAFVESAHNWRWCFYLNLPICGIALVMCFIFLHLSTTYSTLTQKLCMVDWTGGFLFVSSITSFLTAVSWGGITYAWTSWHTLVPLIVGLVGTVLAILYEWRMSSNPFIIKALFSNTSSVITYLSALFQGLVLFMALYYVSFYMAAAKLKSPIEVGISLLPATVLLLPGSIVCSQLITRVGTYRTFMWMGWAATTLGAGMMTYWGVDTKTPYWAASLCVLGLGLGATLSCLTFAVQASTESTLSSSAAAMYAFMRSVGMSLGVAVGGTVFQNRMKRSLHDHDLDEQIATDAERWVSTTLRHLLVMDPVRGAALDAYVHGFRGVWITLAAVSGFALLTAFAVKQYNMDRILEPKVVVKKQTRELKETSGVHDGGQR
ncbi:hypothetical protein DV736_g2412, partial [Chaetothyriales sp. CBS 134916]